MVTQSSTAAPHGSSQWARRDIGAMRVRRFVLCTVTTMGVLYALDHGGWAMGHREPPLPTSRNSPEMSGNLNLVIKIPKSQYTLGESIAIEGVLTNTGGDLLSIISPAFELTLRFFLRTADTEASPLGSKFLFSQRLEAEALSPNESLVFSAQLGGNGLFDFPKQQGTYTILAQYENAMPEFGGRPVWTGRIQSNPLTITVVEKVPSSNGISGDSI